MIRKRTFILAQDYVEKHFGVRCLFPIKPGAKFPPLIRDNLAKASSDLAQLETWEKKWPGCNWGLSHKKSGVLVADIDVNKAKGKIGDETYATLDMVYTWPETETTTTPSGGFHKVYIGPHIFALGENGIGRDIDSPNYTLIPGCMLDDGTSYVGNDVEAVACPQWLYDEIAKNKRSGRTIDNPTDIAVDELDKGENVDWCIDFLKNDAKPSIQFSGGDKALLNTCLVLRDKGISIMLGAQLINDYYTMEPAWDLDDIVKKMQNAYNYAKQEKVGGKTAEADFADQPEEPPPPLSEQEAKRVAAQGKVRHADSKGRAKRQLILFSDDGRPYVKTSKYAYIVNDDGERERVPVIRYVELDK